MEQFKFEKIPIPERGAEVSVRIKFMRHGERDKSGNLLDLGREITKKRAQESGIRPGDFDAVKAIGSDAMGVDQNNLDSSKGMPRSLETADIYATEVAGEELMNTRVNRKLNYETLKTPTHYDHVGIYNSYLPENFDSLEGEEKIKASKYAQTMTVNHAFSVHTPEAERLKKEVAGSFASVILHYADVAKKLKSESKVLIPAGTHGGMMEYLLQQALITKDAEGKERIGFDTLDAVGGEMNPSDSYNIDVCTDEKRQLLPLRVSFDSKNRPQGEMYLDVAKVKELAAFYEDLHKEDRTE